MSNFLKLVGTQLRTIRKARGLTQEELAEKTGKIGVGKSRISDIERGEANLSILRDRDIDEVKYVVSTAKDFLKTVDAKKKKQ